MFEYQAELITRRRYNFEDSKFSLSADSDYCLDSFPSIEEIVSAIEMFNYSEQDILDRLNSTSEFIFEDDFAY